MKLKIKQQPSEFAMYCLELLEHCGAIGPCVIKRMMKGWIISIDSYTFAIIYNNGNGEELWLKACKGTEEEFKKLGCSKFTYMVTFKGKKVPRSLNYYSAPIDSVESPEAIRKYVEMALLAALKK